MTDDDDSAVRRAIASYRVPDVAPDFADAVMNRLAEPAPVASRWRWYAAAGALAAVAVVAIVALRARPVAERGSYANPGRASLELGTRGIAVVEDGADVRWDIASDGSARIEQRAGNVFYRVERGRPFVVETPAGTVSVTGTCFRVEVHPMPLSKQHVVAAAVGAVVAASAAIIVYEGGVRVVNADGSVELAAGERGHVESGSPPVRDRGSEPALVRLGADASRAELAAENAAIAEKLASATHMIEHLNKQLAEARQDPRAQPSNVDPTKDQLLAWAKNCQIHVDTPDVLGSAPAKLLDKDFAEWGITKTERPVIERTLAEFHGKARDEMREIYIAATNNVAGADELTGQAMLTEVFDKATPEDKLRTRERLSRERAGLQAPPANLKDLSPFERTVRLLARLGNDFETVLASSLGATRAHELRTHYNSWPGMQMNPAGCEETGH